MEKEEELKTFSKTGIKCEVMRAAEIVNIMLPLPASNGDAQCDLNGKIRAVELVPVSSVGRAFGFYRTN